MGRLGGNFPVSQKEREARGVELGMHGGLFAPVAWQTLRKSE